MGRIEQTRRRDLSLWQSAVDETIARGSATLGARAVGAGPPTERPDADADLTVASVADFVKTVENMPDLPDPEKQEAVRARGVAESVLFCSGLALKVGAGLVTKLLGKDTAEIERYKQQLRARFGNCDARYAESAIRWAEFLVGGGSIPYRRHKQMSDFVITNKLPANARIGVVGDWGTGQDEAKAVLRLVKDADPNVVIHLGDIYYSGTQFEIDNYFWAPWSSILKLSDGAISSYSLSGNHDMYAGGAAYYRLIDRLGQPASYFCLRNGHWQIIGIDTGKNANYGGPTWLEDSEAEWIKHQVAAFAGRTILMSHHQLFSQEEDLQDGQAVNLKLFRSLEEAIPKVDLWLWGHEHSLVIFEEFITLKRGRCVGCSAFPVGIDSPVSIKHPEVPVRNVALSKGRAFYSHGYAMIELNGPSAKVSYYEDSAPSKPLFEETIP